MEKDFRKYLEIHKKSKNRKKFVCIAESCIFAALNSKKSTPIETALLL